MPGGKIGLQPPSLRQLDPNSRSVPEFSRLRDSLCQNEAKKPTQESAVGSGTGTVANKVPLQSIHEEEDDFEPQSTSHYGGTVPFPPPDFGSMLWPPVRRRHHSVVVEKKSGDEKMRY